MELTLVRTVEDFPGWLDVERLTAFLYEHLKPYEDTPADIRRGIEYALDEAPGRGGFVVLAHEEDAPLGAVVMLETGMGGYVPGTLLLFVAVRRDARGRGIGERIIREAIGHADGDVKLHVEYDNPAKRLYERIGFSNKYAEMRYGKAGRG